MVVIGILLAVVGAVCVYAAVRAKGRVHAMLAADTLGVPELEDLRRISDELGSRGRFRKVCEVVGAAHPTPDGLLTSPLSGTPCVWHSHRVQRRYEHHDRDDEGRTRVSTRTETVAEQTAGHGFALIRDGLTIGIDTGGRRPDGVEQVADRFEEGQQRTDGGWIGVLGALAGGDRDETIGFQYTEWVLRPGTPMYVLGEVHDTHGPLVMGPPADPKQPFVLSTKTEEQLSADARGKQRWMAWSGAALVVVGVPLAVAGLL